MPLPSGPAGTGKKAGPGAMMRAQPRSRNTTPSAMPPTASLPSTESVDTEMLDLRFDVFRNLTYDDLVDGGSAHAFVPDSRSLDGIILRLQRLAEIIEKRGQHCDRGMRLMAQIRAQSHRSRVEDGVVDPPADQDEGHAAAKANKRKRKAGDNPGPGPKGKRGELLVPPLVPCAIVRALTHALRTIIFPRQQSPPRFARRLRQFVTVAHDAKPRTGRQGQDEG